MQVQPDSNKTVSGRSIALWAGVLGSPMVWAIQLQVVYALTPWLARHGMYVVTHLVSLVCLLLVIAFGWLSLHEWKCNGGGSPEPRGGSPQDRSRFLGGLGVLSCIIFAAAYFRSGIARLFLRCKLVVIMSSQQLQHPRLASMAKYSRPHSRQAYVRPGIPHRMSAGFAESSVGSCLGRR